MLTALLTLGRSLALLRHPEVLLALGERRQELQVLGRLRTQFPTLKVANSVQICGDPTNRVNIGSGVTIGDGTILSFGNGMGHEGAIEIGANTWIGQYNNLRAGGGRLQIGQQCLISQMCTLVVANHGRAKGQAIIEQPMEVPGGGIVLEDDVWLGAGVTVLPGVTIRRGAVIGAGAVVTREVPEFEIWGGVPARKIGERASVGGAGLGAIARE